MATDTEAFEALIKLYQNTRVPDPAKVQTVDKGKFKADAVGHADVTDILLEHDITWNWRPMTAEETPTGGPALEQDKSGNPCGLWIYLRVCGLERPGYGSVESSAREPVKELIGDAIRNAAMRFGVALTLWSKTERDAAQTSPGRAEAGGSRPETGTSPAVPSEPWMVTKGKVDAFLAQGTAGYDGRREQLIAQMDKEKLPLDLAAATPEQLTATEALVASLTEPFLSGHD